MVPTDKTMKSLSARGVIPDRSKTWSGNEKVMGSRRVFLKQSFVAGCSILTLSHTSGVIAQWPISNLDNLVASDTLRDLLDGESAEKSDLLTIETPAVTENAALVPVSVRHQLTNLQSLVLLVDALEPVAASFRFSQQAPQRISTRIRLMEPTRLWVIATAGSTRYISNAPVEFMPFNCEG